MKNLMTESDSLKIEIRTPYFVLCHALIGAGWRRAATMSVLGAACIVGLGFLSANLSGRNYLLEGFLGIRPWMERHYLTDSLQLNMLAFLYIIATVFFFTTNLFVLPLLLRLGLPTFERISRIYPDEDRTRFCDDVKEEIENPRHCVAFVVGIVIVFLLGELGVIYRQWHLPAASRWSGLFVAYLLIVPVCMNGIMVGTESSLVYSLIKIVKKHLPPLPAKLYDDDGYAGLGPAGGFICFSSLCWFFAMLMLTPLFYLSGGPGFWMFLALGLVGLALFSIPLYQFHKKLQDRKTRLLAIYADALNRCLGRYGARPSGQMREQLKMLQECYTRAEALKVWLPFFGPSIGLQILSVLWAVVNEPLTNGVRKALDL